MGWGIDFKTDIFLSKQDYGGNIHQVEGKMEELNDEIKETTAQLKMYAVANLTEVVPTDWEGDKIIWVSNEINTQLESLNEHIRLLYQLGLYKEYLQEKK